MRTIAFLHAHRHRNRKPNRSLLGERGGSMVEFLISIPFLLTLIIGLIDIGRGMREYFLLKNAVSSGAERAMSLADLPSGSEFFSLTAPGCTSGPHDSNHELVHQRVESLIGLQNLALTSPCISSQLSTTSGTSSDNTVKVRATARFQAIFPMFNRILISAEARMPYLRSS